ncbi:MAG: hypothetical protein SOW59_09670, partial [Corynebacterium sp.]|nr:hypothetical protein [Corynebacterium sp.]
MNPVLMFKLARTGWNRFNDYRAKKAEEAYAALEDIANSSLVDDTRARAGAVTKAAQQRLEDRLSLLADAPSQLRPKK